MAASARSQVVLGHSAPTILELAFGFVDPASLVAAIPVSRFWSGVSSSDEVWGGHCKVLWRGKVYVPDRFALDACDGARVRRIEAYWGSLADSRRASITPEELCGFTWSSRMKKSAGDDWTRSDPWWQTPPQPAGTRRYRADGTATSSRGEGTWRFVPSACGKSGPAGSFVRHGRDGIEFPTHFVSRWEKNWGWVMQNCWGFSASFELPLRGDEPELEDDAALCRSVSVLTCEEEATCFNLGLPLPHSLRDDPFRDRRYGSLTVTINGRPRSIPRELILQLLQDRMLQGARGDSDDDEDSERPDGEGDSPTELDVEVELGEASEDAEEEEEEEEEPLEQEASGERAGDAAR